MRDRMILNVLTCLVLLCISSTSIAVGEENLRDKVSISAELDGIQILYEIKNISSETLFVASGFCYEINSNVIVLNEGDLSPRDEHLFHYLSNPRGPLTKLLAGESEICGQALNVAASPTQTKEGKTAVIFWQIRYFIGDDRGNHKTDIEYGSIRTSLPIGNSNKVPKVAPDESSINWYKDRKFYEEYLKEKK